MNKLKIFENPQFGKVRLIEIKKEPWFVGKDVAEALGYSDPSSAVSKNVDPEDKTTLLLEQDGSNYKSKTSLINESGVYSLVLSSKLPAAKQFKHWITSEVLPSIRKTGGYTSKPMTDYQQMMADTRRRNARVQAARLLTQLAKQYSGTTYEQVLNAHATKELTGEYLLPLPKLEAKTYSAEEIGEMLGISKNKVGQLANKHGLKASEYGQWFKDKSPYSDKEVPCFRYFDGIVPVLRSIMDDQ